MPILWSKVQTFLRICCRFHLFQTKKSPKPQLRGWERSVVVPVEEGEYLGPGEHHAGREGGDAGAVGDVFLHGPANGFSLLSGQGGQVGEGVDGGDGLGRTGQFSQVVHHFCTGARGVDPHRIAGLIQEPFIGTPHDGVVEIIALGHIGEAVGALGGVGYGDTAGAGSLAVGGGG